MRVVKEDHRQIVGQDLLELRVDRGALGLIGGGYANPDWLAAELANLEQLSRFAVEETGLGRYEDKLGKNRLVAEKTL